MDEALATDNPAFAEAIEARGSRRQGLAAASEMWRTPVDKVQVKAEPEQEPERNRSRNQTPSSPLASHSMWRGELNRCFTNACF